VREERPDIWVFWVYASSSIRFEEGYGTIAERVGLPGWNEPKADILGLVSAWLSDEDNGRWVMIIDNADDTDVLFKPVDGRTETNSTFGPRLGSRSLSDYIPQSTHGSVVITSRSRDVAYMLTGRTRDILDVAPMDPDTSVVLLRKKLEDDTRDEDLISLVRSLDGMPLAITQAAAYINQRAPRMTTSKYLEELGRSDTDRAKLLQRDLGDPRRDGRASNSIITTWHVSFMYIRQARASAARLLALMSLFDREAIPEYLLYGYREESDVDEDFEDDIDMLRSYYLVGVSKGDDMFEMHRLVQLSMKKWLEQNSELERWQKRYVDNMYKAFPWAKYENWSTCQALFPHVEAMRLFRPTHHDYLRRWATVLYNAGTYAAEYGRYGLAEVMERESLEARDLVLGKEHPDTLRSMNNLANVLGDQGKYEQAEEIYRQTLRLNETVLGKEHPDTLASMNNLAIVLREQGKYEQAEEMHRQTLKLSETVLGKEHPDTLGSMNNLANVLGDQGKYEQAEETHRQTLRLRETVLGKEHPNTLGSMNNLATVLYDQGKYEQAEEIYRQTLRLRETVLGKEHPDTLASMNNLAVVLRDQGRSAEAEELRLRVMEIRTTSASGHSD
jgi:tetratricopeptide (TPR) repeat protein